MLKLKLLPQVRKLYSMEYQYEVCSLFKVSDDKITLQNLEKSIIPALANLPKYDKYIWYIICETNQFSALPLRFFHALNFCQLDCFYLPKSPCMSTNLAIYEGGREVVQETGCFDK